MLYNFTDSIEQNRLNYIQVKAIKSQDMDVSCFKLITQLNKYKIK